MRRVEIESEGARKGAGEREEEGEGGEGEERRRGRGMHIEMPRDKHGEIERKAERQAHARTCVLASFGLRANLVTCSTLAPTSTATARRSCLLG